MQPVSAALLERCVFSKQFFDREGLIVATKDGQPVGFAHAVFGPNEAENSLATEVGTTQLLMVDESHRQSELAAELLTHAEEYLRSRGAKVLYAGGIRPFNGFYLGLYGGSELPGVLSTDPADRVLRMCGYREIDRVIILQRELATFRPVISRDLRYVRREVVFEEVSPPRPSSWWDACTQGGVDPIGFRLLRRTDRSTLASVWFWDVEPLATSWGMRTAGMFEMYVEPNHRRRGLATQLMNEAVKQLRLRGMSLVEAQTMHHNQPALSLYGKLGFQTVDCGYVFRKESPLANGMMVRQLVPSD
jgi:GNAT superfamily N-acetyltransferase